MENNKQENHFHHQKLSSFEKKLIHDRTDYPVISLIDALTPEQIQKINDSILYKSEYLKHSCLMQMDWINNFMYFWGEKNKEDPKDNPHCLEDFRESIHPLRYRLWFAVHYPEEVEILENKGDYKLTKDFLEEARKEYKLACLRNKK
ncbi:MAG: hypothetical protein PHQ66_01195 [Candidatus Nanoarchaeia archaeon]|nr:hypothetical protein [Candidatus Nanoarchaeia archaeon]MDD5358006.1 hypothetical protein [Candidatus Nanoarchaeia archaeon]MDD5588925.1 hypothetical protein [Candidatus Nanoarchaeia archaeon]